MSLTLIVLNLALVTSLLVGCGPTDGEVDPNATKVLEGDLEPPICDSVGVKLRYPKSMLKENASAPTGLVSDSSDPRSVDPRADEPVDVAFAQMRDELIANGWEGGHIMFFFGDEPSSEANKMLLAFQDGELPDNTPVAVRGYVRNDVIDVGNCEDPPAYVSKVTFFESPYKVGAKLEGTFLLRQVHREPYCEGQPLVGTLAGCFKSQ